MKNSKNRYLLGQDFEMQEEDLIQYMKREMHIFVGASHLQWGLWGIVQAVDSQINSFGYLEYSWARFQMYLKWKENLKSF